jgi:hypothetical protein
MVNKYSQKLGFELNFGMNTPYISRQGIREPGTASLIKESARKLQYRFFKPKTNQ